MMAVVAVDQQGSRAVALRSLPSSAGTCNSLVIAGCRAHARKGLHAYWTMVFTEIGYNVKASGLVKFVPVS